MPELKNSFTGGKMNKDLDERIIPSTDYRDALNIGVATSEDSDVGAAQNILGNTRVSCAIQGPGNPGLYHEMSKHITAVADNQNDKIYRFVNTEKTSFPGVWMDRIIEFDVNKSLNASCEEKEKAVMVDIYKVQTTVDSVQSECADGPVTISVSGNVFQLRWGMLVVGGGLTALDGVTVLGVTITSTSTANLLLSADNTGNNPTITTGSITLEADRVLNFSSDRFITGVNILDGMIFWTDNYSEPKKVNIERGLAGSLMTHELSNYQYKSFDQHTKLVVNDINPTECTKISPNGCGEEGKIYGCTDSNATNYDPIANSEDGSCTYAEGENCNDPDWLAMGWGNTSQPGYSHYKYDYCDRCADGGGNWGWVTFNPAGHQYEFGFIFAGATDSSTGVNYCGCCPTQTSTCWDCGNLPDGEGISSYSWNPVGTFFPDQLKINLNFDFAGNPGSYYEFQAYTYFGNNQAPPDITNYPASASQSNYTANTSIFSNAPIKIHNLANVQTRVVITHKQSDGTQISQCELDVFGTNEFNAKDPNSTWVNPYTSCNTQANPGGTGFSTNTSACIDPSNTNYDPFCMNTPSCTPSGSAC